MTQTARTLLFDFDHTLGTDGKLEERVLRGLAIRYCDRIPSDAEIAAALDAFRSGRVALDTMVEEAVASWGGRGSAIVAHEYRAVAIALVSASVEPMPGARETVRLARRLERRRPRDLLQRMERAAGGKGGGNRLPGRGDHVGRRRRVEARTRAFQRGAAA